MLFMVLSGWFGVVLGWVVDARRSSTAAGAFFQQLLLLTPLVSRIKPFCNR